LGWNGSGGYVRAENFSADSSSGIKILATRMDTEFDDFASAMTLCLTRNGQNSPTGNVPMAGFKFTNVGAAASAEDYMRAKEFIRDIPVFVRDKANTPSAVQVSTTFFVSVSAGQSPPDGTRIKVLIATGGSKTSTTCSFNLFTPLNTSAGVAPHVAPIWTRDHKFDPLSLRGDHVYDFCYDASASGWLCLNPSRSYKSYQCRAKVLDNNGVVCGRASASTNIALSRNQSEFIFQLATAVSVSTSISGKYLVFSADGVTSMTSGVGGNHTIPITVKDVFSPIWNLTNNGANQMAATAAFPGLVQTTVSAACTIRAAPFTAIFLTQ